MNATSPSEFPPTFQIPFFQNCIEYAAIVAWWGLVLGILSSTETAAETIGETTWLTHLWPSLIVVVGCGCKSIFFGAENMKQLFEAAKSNLSHHRFLMLMGINMSQMILSFAFDFHLLYVINPASFSGVAKDVSSFEAMFDFFYLSTLNFSFFGYSDILPQTIPAKIVNLTEIVLAFITVIFLLSDFISLKDSLRGTSSS